MPTMMSSGRESRLTLTANDIGHSLLRAYLETCFVGSRTSEKAAGKAREAAISIGYGDVAQRSIPLS